MSAVGNNEEEPTKDTLQGVFFKKKRVWSEAGFSYWDEFIKIVRNFEQKINKPTTYFISQT